MKKRIIFLSGTLYVAVLIMLFVQDGLAQDIPVPPVHDNYWVDSLKIIPEKAYEGDIINLVAFTTHTSGGCDLEDYRIWKFGSIIIVDATYEQGLLTYMCHSVDTMRIGMLPAGSYILLFDWSKTIEFRVYPNQQHCQAYFTWVYLKCLTEKCLNTVAFIDSSQGDVVEWMWDFGDGQTSEEQNPVHTYSFPGIYNVCLTIATSDGCTSIYCDKVRVGIPDECKAFFEVIYTDCYSNDISDCLSNYVAFLDKSLGNIEHWYWDFGDGHTSEEQNPVHEYENEGIYEGCLTIQTYDGCTDIYCDSVFVYMPWCKADFTWEELRCADSLAPCIRTYRFIDLSVGESMKWYWSFGDGDSSALQNPVHMYEKDGVYEVSLTIHTYNGCTDTKLDTIIVGDTVYPQCKADFRWDMVFPTWDCLNKSTNCIAPYPYYDVWFFDESVGAITDWEWDFGDGYSSFEQNPFHEYKFAGKYEVGLLIKAKGGCSDSICKTVTVGDTIPGLCKADFKISKEILPCPDCMGCYCVKFIDQSSWNTVEWYWDFGDGDTSTLQNPEHMYIHYPNDTLFTVCLTIKTSDHCMDTICKIYDPVLDSLYSGINDNRALSEVIAIYPNPSDNEIFIDLIPDATSKECLLNIVDLYGRKVDVQKYNLTAASHGSITYNVANLSNGQYICLVILDKKLYVGRFTVNK